MSDTVPPAPADRLALIIEGLCHAVAGRLGLGRLAGPFIILIWSRLRRIKTRFAANAACHATTPPPIPCRPQAVPKAVPKAVFATPGEERGKQSTRRPPSSAPLLPRRKAWLLRLVPEAAAGAAQLRHFLIDPEVAALLTEAPQLRRILRPLCHMLGIRPAAILPSAAPPPAATDPSFGGAAQGSARVAGGIAAEETPPSSRQDAPDRDTQRKIALA